MHAASESSAAHRAEAADAARARPVSCAVLTVSDTRTVETDEGGTLVARLLAEAGHAVRAREIVRDDPPRIEAVLRGWIDDPSLDAVVTTGGTGIAPRDTTVEVVRRLLAVELEGFGELFRMLSYQQVGAAAMLSRAVGGLATRDGAPPVVIFALPGSVNAVETGMRGLIVPELAHLVWERRR